MSPKLRTALLTVAVVAVAALFTVSVRSLLQRQRTRIEIEGLRARLFEARGDAQSCQRSLAARERAFRRLDADVDSLREAVRAFERMDARGVPEEQYEAYLEAFDGYNDSVGVWEAQAGALRAAEEACRGVVETHNALADSLRRRLEAEGIAGELEPGS